MARILGSIPGRHKVVIQIITGLFLKHGWKEIDTESLRSYYCAINEKGIGNRRLGQVLRGSYFFTRDRKEILRSGLPVGKKPYCIWVPTKEFHTWVKEHPKDVKALIRWVTPHHLRKSPWFLAKERRNSNGQPESSH